MNSVLYNQIGSMNLRAKKIISKVGKTFIFVSLNLVIISHAYSQDVPFEKDNFKDKKSGLKEAKSNLKEGDEFYESGSVYYNQALEYYLKANTFNANNAQLNYRIGKCYLFSNYKFKSIPFLEKAKKLNSEVDRELNFYLGKAYHLDQQWDKAIETYNAFKVKLKPQQDADLLAQVSRGIEECWNGKELVKNPIRVFIDNPGSEINSQYTEYGAVISADESVLIFTSRRPGSTGGNIDPVLNEYFEDIYISHRQENGNWSPALNMREPVNSDDHDANSGLSADGQRFLIYLGKKNNGDIYESELKGDKWKRPESVSKHINSDFHESSACYSPDGKSIYFVSDKPDGSFGGRDIYVSILDEKGKWSKAVNLGSMINTKYDEEGVFIHPNGRTLYFSSKGHNSMGGYDVFKSNYDAEAKVWMEPVNIGYPVNTPDDDVFFVLSADGKHGYYTSINDKGLGGKDIYMVTFLGPEKALIQNNEDNLLASIAAPVSETVIAPTVEIKEAQLTILKGVVLDEATKKPLEAIVDIIDNASNEVIASFKSNSSSGKFLVSLPAGKNYGIAVKKVDYLFHSENFDIPKTAAYQEVTKEILLKSISVGSKIILKNIFFDFNSSNLRMESSNELERLAKLLNDVPSLKIEIAGYTDSKGSDEYNRKLSNDRAKAVVDHLIKLGISSDRLVYKGYGEKDPIATNDAEDGRQLNRRTEFKVLSK
jgi:outer membrane protein OmpA-like peptidoglycan-associated protein